MQQALHTWIWEFSGILLCRSSQALSGWTGTIRGQPFSGLSRCLIGFKSGLWLGHLRALTELSLSHTFVVLAVCLGPLSCWKVNLWASLRSWVLWNRFSLRISLYFAGFSLPFTLTNAPGPAAEKQPHSYHHLLGIEAKQFNLLFIRPWESFMCFFGCKFQAGFHVSCTEEMLSSGHSAIKPR